MTDPIRRVKGTPLPPTPSHEGRGKKESVQHYNLDEMVIDGSVSSAPKPETFGVSRLWQSQSKDPATLMIVYEGDIQKYRQHLMAYVSHLIRHYEEMGVTPNVGLSAPGFQMEPVPMNDTGKGDIFNALLDLDPKGETPAGADDLTLALDWASGILRHPKFHGDQKSVLLFVETISPEALLAESVLLEGDKIALNVVRDFNHSLRLHGGETPATWEDVTADLRAVLSHIRPDVREDRVSRTDEFFLRLGVAQLKYPDKPLLELIHAVHADWKYGDESRILFHTKSPFTVPNCTLSRAGCTLDMTSAALYFDSLREIGTFEAFLQYTEYAVLDFNSSEEVKDILRYASMPVETLIDTLIRPGISVHVKIATELLRPESLTPSQKERIRSRIEAMIPLTPDGRLRLISDPTRTIFRNALRWRLAFDAITEVKSLDSKFVEYYKLESEDLIFGNSKVLHPELLAVAFWDAIDFKGRDFRWEGEWKERFTKLDRATQSLVINVLAGNIDKEPWRIRLYMRAVGLAHPSDSSFFIGPLHTKLDKKTDPLELTPGEVISAFHDILIVGEYSQAFKWVVTLWQAYRHGNGVEDPTVTAEDPEPLHLYLQKWFEESLSREKMAHRIQALVEQGTMASLLKYGHKNEWEGIALDWVRELLEHHWLPPEFYKALSARLDFSSKAHFEVLYAFIDKHPEVFKKEFLEKAMAGTREYEILWGQRRYGLVLPLLKWIDDHAVEDRLMTPEIRESLGMWGNELSWICSYTSNDPVTRQMIIYRLQRIVKRIGCSDEVRKYLGPESGVEKVPQRTPMDDEIWRESLKPIQEACKEE